MKFKAVRHITLILTIILALSVFVSCKTEQETTTSAPTAAPATSAPAQETEEPIPTLAVAPWDKIPVRTSDPVDMEWMYDVSPITLTMFVNHMDDSGWQWGNDRVTQYLTERSGVTLEYTFSPDGEGNRLTLMLASGDPLPDFISYVVGNGVHMNEMIEGEYIYALNELIDQYAPRFWDILDSAEKTYMKKEDGNIYALPSQFATHDYLNSPFLGVNGAIAARGDILDELGNPKLETIDDLFAVLDAFKEIKANHPEVKYPFYTTIYDIWTGQPFYSVFGGRTGMGYASQGLDYNIEDNTIEYFYNKEPGIAYLRFLNQLYREGYLTAEMFTDDDPLDVYSAGALFINFSNNVWQVDAAAPDALEQNAPGAYYTRVRPIVAEEGQPYVWTVPMWSCVSSNCVVISKDCANPERAIKFLEFIRTEEAQLTIAYGIYGQDYEITTDDLGINYPVRIGETEGADITTLNNMGIYNYQRTWFTFLNLYDATTVYYQRYMPGKEEQVAIKDAWKACRDESTPNNIAFSIALDAGSDLAVLKANCEDIIKNMLPKIVLAKNDAEFETQYQALLDSLETAGVQNLYAGYLPLIAETLDQLREMGFGY